MISIISVTYNGIEVTAMMIDSVIKYLSIPYELIIVDNGSSANEAQLLKDRYGDKITTLRSEHNMGFAGGNNLGISNSHGEYVMLLNNDTELDDDSVKYLVDFLETHTDYGAVSPKIIFWDSGKIQYAGYTEISKVTIRNRTIGLGEDDNGQYEISGETSYAHGAAMMVKREVIEKVGYMPEIFFLYYEEMDWCEMIRRSGYKIGFEPRCRIYHKESSAIGINSPTKCYYMSRNRLLFAYRNRKGLITALSILYQLTVVLTKEFWSHILKGQSAQACAALRGARDFFRLKHKLL